MWEQEVDLATQAKMIKQASEGEEYKFGGKILADPSIWFKRAPVSKRSPGSILQDMKKFGIDFKKAKGGMHGTDEHVLVSKVRLWLEANKILFFDDLVHCIIEHQSWKHRESKDGDPTEKYEDRLNDTCDGVKYLVAERLTYHTMDGMMVTTVTGPKKKPNIKIGQGSLATMF
jgi:hypothetical protein